LSLGAGRCYKRRTPSRAELAAERLERISDRRRRRAGIGIGVRARVDELIQPGDKLSRRLVVDGGILDSVSTQQRRQHGAERVDVGVQSSVEVTGSVAAERAQPEVCQSHGSGRVDEQIARADGEMHRSNCMRRSKGRCCLLADQHRLGDRQRRAPIGDEQIHGSAGDVLAHDMRDVVGDHDIEDRDDGRMMHC
jgi:hypothetical protein